MGLALKITPEINEVESQALTIPEQADTLMITDSVTYTRAGEFWKEIRAMRGKVAATFDPLVKQAHELHRETLAKKNEIDRPLEAAEKKVKRLMADYDREQERKRREEEDRLREIARKQEEERRLAEALAAEAAGEKEEAEAILEEEVYIPPPVVPKATPKVEGVSFRTAWKFRIVNESAIPRNYMVPDTVKIGGVVRAMKSATNIPGVEVYEERV